jgi:hypothetical protein
MQLRKLADDKAFLGLDRRLKEFNIFEALGAVRQELRHSDFLAFLLNPYSSHGLRGRFTEILLDEIAKCPASETHWVPVTLTSESRDTVEVRRAWRNIDILLRFPSLKLALIIENKIDSLERDGQLKKYWKTVLTEFPGWAVRGIYLTPDGEKPGNIDYSALGIT